MTLLGRRSPTSRRSGSDRTRRGEPPRARRVGPASGVLLLACLATALAACGSSTRSSRTAGLAAHSRATQFADCMRSHGVSNFPDPSSDGSFPTWFPPSKMTQSPAFQPADHACRSLAPRGFDQTPHLSAQQRHAAIQFARCMRAHGVPGFPDPTFNPPSSSRIAYLFGGAVGYVAPPSTNVRSPAGRHAASVCGVRQLAGESAPS